MCWTPPRPGRTGTPGNCPGVGGTGGGTQRFAPLVMFFDFGEIRRIEIHEKNFHCAFRWSMLHLPPTSSLKPSCAAMPGRDARGAAGPTSAPPLDCRAAHLHATRDFLLSTGGFSHVCSSVWVLGSSNLPPSHTTLGRASPTPHPRHHQVSWPVGEKLHCKQLRKLCRAPKTVQSYTENSHGMFENSAERKFKTLTSFAGR